MLEPGVHNFTIEETIKKFCTTPARTQFQEPLEYIFKYAYETGAKSILIGGSFVTNKLIPNDLDFLIIYEKDESIPHYTGNLAFNSVRLDFLFASYENKETVDLYISLFSHDKSGNERGILQIRIDEDDSIQKIPVKIDQRKFELIKNTYAGRQIVERNTIKGIIISIHGLLSRAEWNVDISPIASSQGWIFAPYVYQNPTRALLFSKKRRQRTVDDFREWVYDISERYKDQTDNLSIVAHSYGTYIIGAYLNGFDKLPININSIILTGSILNNQYDWSEHFNTFKIGRVLNIYSHNDGWVKSMSNHSAKKHLGMSVLFGNAGYKGFKNEHPYLLQRELEILNHTNTIKRDIIEHVWMPFLNINCNSLAVNKNESTKR